MRSADDPGPLGNYYLPTNSLLVNTGSTRADYLGLYHFTTDATNQVKEGISTVNIGLHYVAVNALKQPVDSDSEGRPDYLEDRNGNGTLDTGESDPAQVDTDYDGRSDAQEFGDGTDPQDASKVERVRLAYWRFNTNTWDSEAGRPPIVALNVTNVNGYDGGALQMNNTAGTSILKFREIETNGVANINLRNGAVRFRYKPFWDTVYNPPGESVRLLEVGNWTSGNSVGWFSLSIDPQGTNLVLATQNGSGSGITATNLQLKIDFVSNTWYQIEVSFSPTNCTLAVPALTIGVVTNTSGGVLYPPATVRAAGFTIGGSTNGTMQARGLIDELETFNYPLGRIDRSLVALRLSAEATITPPAITLQWNRILSNLSIERRLRSGTNWTLLTTNASSLSFTDTNNILTDTVYEYRLSHPASTLSAYVLAGINLSPIENRGRVILLVDNTVTNALAWELNQLKTNLVGDGWTVRLEPVPRHNDTNWSANTGNIAAVKSLLVSNYQASPSNTSVFIIGHVPVPYSGYFSFDGHHERMFPADAYYGDTNDWPDVVPYIGHQTVGDGYFDPNYLPSKVEMPVGRIDFANMPVFTNNPHAGVTSVSEIDLLRRYLAKDHAYRQGLLALPERAVVASYFTTTAVEQENDISVYFKTLRNVPQWWGSAPEKTLEGDLFREKIPALWGIQGGPGFPEAINADPNFPYSYTNHYRSSWDLADPAKEPPIGFYFLLGSFFGDWNYETNNFLRATIATPNYGLGAMWQRAIAWRFDPLGVGEHIGAALLWTQNLTNETIPIIPVSLLGDPTLRLKVIAPPVYPKAAAVSGSVLLTWASSSEANSGYFVYRSTNGITGEFPRLTSSPIAGNTFMDSSAPVGEKLYQIRAVTVSKTGSGSYTNLSQGAFVIAN